MRKRSENKEAGQDDAYSHLLLEGMHSSQCISKCERETASSGTQGQMDGNESRVRTVSMVCGVLVTIVTRGKVLCVCCGM